MTYLILSILCSVLLVLIFKAYPIYSVNTGTAIVFNYLFAALTNLWVIGSIPSVAAIAQNPWFFNAMVLGTLFISVFNFIGYSAIYMGVSLTSLAGKMSVVIPVVFALLFFNEPSTWQLWLGIALALVALIMAMQKKEEPVNVPGHRKGWAWILLLLVFLGSGIIDSIIKYNEQQYLEDESSKQLFTLTVFGVAFLLGFFQVLFNAGTMGKWPNHRDVLGGLALGVPNFGAAYFLIKTLAEPNWNATVIFPINNIAIVLLSALTGWLIFKEKLSKLNWLGIALGALSIAVIALYS